MHVRAGLRRKDMRRSTCPRSSTSRWREKGSYPSRTYPPGFNRPSRYLIVRFDESSWARPLGRNCFRRLICHTCHESKSFRARTSSKPLLSLCRNGSTFFRYIWVYRTPVPDMLPPPSVEIPRLWRPVSGALCLSVPLDVVLKNLRRDDGHHLLRDQLCR